MALFAGLCAAVAFYLMLRPTGPPADQDLIANFEKNKDGFEELIKMIRGDAGLEVVDDTWTRPQNPRSIGITEARIKNYKELFKRLNTPRGFNTLEGSATTHLKVDLNVYAVGMVAAGASKGYSYLEVLPSANIVDNLDGINDTSPGDHVYYRHIAGNWYLYFEAN